jgi:proline iminopeptidase
MRTGDRMGRGCGLELHEVRVATGCDIDVERCAGDRGRAVTEALVTTPDGADLWCAVTGAGPPLVLCHGGPGMWDYLEPLAARLDDTATVVRFDQRGCGRSTGGAPYSVAGAIADLDVLRAHLGYETWIVGGHSWGATLALHYAFAHPEHTAAVVYLSGVGIAREWHPAYHTEADRRRDAAQRAHLAALKERSRSADEERDYRVLTWFPDYAPGPAAMEHAARLAAVPFAINREANRQLSDETKTWDEAALARQAAALRVPVLIVHGELDPRPHWAVDSLAAALPNVTVRKITGAGHLPWIEAPDETVEAVRAVCSV